MKSFNAPLGLLIIDQELVLKDGTIRLILPGADHT